MNENKPPIYLDCNATTPVDPRVLEKMLPFFTERFGNAASRHHQKGCDAAKAVESAREKVAVLLRADPREIIFTSGATESNNLALQGIATSPFHRKNGNHIITVATEHKAVLDPLEQLSENKISVTHLRVSRKGEVDLDQLRSAITAKTILVSVMHANNETGVIHPIKEIGSICKEHSLLFHTDATQSFGKEIIDVGDFGIDLLSLSAHKLYGPKGAGALYVRRKNPRVRCAPILHGGGHERGLRSGTLNVPGIVGLGTAAELCESEMKSEQPRIRSLRDRLETILLTEISKTEINGNAPHRLANTCNLSFSGVDGESLMQTMPGILVSSASACTSASLQPSYVLGAHGYSEERILGSVRFSLGRFTTEEEIDDAIPVIIRSVDLCRRNPAGSCEVK